jgi:hypothetical protein
VRPPAVLSDEAVERYLAALRVEVDPDPAFRRRLRGVVLNQYVASREAALAGLVPRAMRRLGRSVLYASFALGVSVTGVMAASEVAVPGDVLYPVKRAIEDMRVHVLPGEFEDELIIHELNERFSELAALVDREETTRVEALATEVAAEYAAVITLAETDGEPLDRRTELLESLVAQLPEQARVTLDEAIATVGVDGNVADHGGGTPASGRDPGRATGGGNGQGGNGAPGHAAGGGSGGGEDGGRGSSGSGAGSSGSSTPASSHAPGAGGENHGTGNGSAGGNGGGNGGGNQGEGGRGDGRPDDDDPSPGEGKSHEASPTPKPASSPKPKKSPSP